ncbi:MAG: hypothetical protein U0163_14535 [Gemmatimonadaceae bacterium]
MTTTALQPTTVTLRAYSSADRASVRRLACLTAFRNAGHTVLLCDPEPFADYWTRYYTDFEPEHLTVVVAKHSDHASDQVVGYLAGCVNTRQANRAMGMHVLPRVVTRLVQHVARIGSTDALRARRLLHWMLTRAWREAPSFDATRYPAHYHANVLPEFAGQHLYTRLALRFIGQVEARGVQRMHGQVTESRDRGPWLRFVQRFVAGQAASTLAVKGTASTLHEALCGVREPMVNRVIYGSCADFRSILNWLQATYAL